MPRIKKYTIIADIECCVINITEHGETSAKPFHGSAKSYTNKYVIAEHIPISVGYMFKGETNCCFSLDCIKRFAADLMTIETENNFQYNKQIIFTTEDEIILIIYVIYVVKPVLRK